MPVTKEQAQMLAALAVACRPFGAPHWDAPGVVAAIAKVHGRALADVGMAVLRAASDPEARTPGVLTAPDSMHWREKLTPQLPPRPPRAGEACGVCGKRLDACACGERERRPNRSERNREHAEQARRLMQEAKTKGDGDG